MKNICTRKAKRIHPSPPLAALPAAVITLTAALSPAEKDVLSYLLSAIAGQDKLTGKNNTHIHTHTHIHPPDPGCGCFGCYKTFWARWDASPNRHVIHRILDAVEESAEPIALIPCQRRRRRLNRQRDSKVSPVQAGVKDEEFANEYEGKDEDKLGESADSGDCPSPARRFVSFIGELLKKI